MLLAQGNWLYAGSGLNACCVGGPTPVPVFPSGSSPSHTQHTSVLRSSVAGVNPSDCSEPLNSPNHLHVGGDSQVA